MMGQNIERNTTIETEQLTKVFGNYTAVNKISIKVYKGEIFGFLGANGAGKTTAIRMLCGLLEPTNGKGKVAGFDIMRETSQIRKRIGYMAQKFSLYTDLKVIDNLNLYGQIYGLKGKTLKDRIDHMVEFLDMKDLLKRKTGDLPWGWQQRLSLACSNLHSPEILFLDEPTGSVDPLSRRNFWQFITNIASTGVTVFITTHHMDEAEYCHRLSIMVAGEIKADESPAQLKMRLGAKSLHDAFIKLVSQSMNSIESK